MSLSNSYCKNCSKSLSGDPGAKVRRGLCTPCFNLNVEIEDEKFRQTQQPNTKNKIIIIFFSLLFFIPVADFFLSQDLPWAYFQILKIVAFLGFGYLSIAGLKSSKADEPVFWLLVFAAFAILYNPIFPISLGSREAWSGANFLSFAILLWYAFQPNIDPEKPLKVRAHEKQKHVVASDQSKTRIAPKASKNRTELIKLISGPLEMQASFILAKSGGLEYLKSNSAIGFVAGFADAFLQRANNQTNFDEAEEIAIITVVLSSVLEAGKVNPGKLFTLQDSGDPEFSMAQHDGGTYAFGLLNDPSNQSLHLYWTTVADDWIMANGLGEDIEKQKLLAKYEKFTSACTLLEYDESIYELAYKLNAQGYEWCLLFIEKLDANPKQNAAELFAEINKKIDQELRPYDSDEANSALAAASTISHEAKEEFMNVYDLLGDKLGPNEILDKIKKKFS